MKMIQTGSHGLMVKGEDAYSKRASSNPINQKYISEIKSLILHSLSHGLVVKGEAAYSKRWSSNPINQKYEKLNTFAK